MSMQRVLGCACLLQRRERNTRSMVALTEGGAEHHSPTRSRHAHHAHHGHESGPEASNDASWLEHGAGSPMVGQGLVAGGADFVVDTDNEDEATLPGSSSVPILPDLGPGRLVSGGAGRVSGVSHSHSDPALSRRQRKPRRSRNRSKYQLAYKQSFEAYSKPGQA